jgi:hypothetical protein
MVVVDGTGYGLNRNGSTIDSCVAISQEPPNCAKDRTVAKPALGTKRLCASCGAKFYDLNKVPIRCPKCAAVYEVVVATRPVRPAGPVTARPPVPKEAPAPEPQEVETVSLEEADAEPPRSPRPRKRGSRRKRESRRKRSRWTSRSTTTTPSSRNRKKRTPM